MYLGKRSIESEEAKLIIRDCVDGFLGTGDGVGGPDLCEHVGNVILCLIKTFHLFRVRKSLNGVREPRYEKSPGTWALSVDTLSLFLSGPSLACPFPVGTSTYIYPIVTHIYIKFARIDMSIILINYQNIIN